MRMRIISPWYQPATGNILQPGQEIDATSDEIELLHYHGVRVEVEPVPDAGQNAAPVNRAAKIGKKK